MTGPYQVYLWGPDKKLRLKQRVRGMESWTSVATPIMAHHCLISGCIKCCHLSEASDISPWRPVSPLASAELQPLPSSFIQTETPRGPIHGDHCFTSISLESLVPATTAMAVILNASAHPLCVKCPQGDPPCSQGSLVKGRGYWASCRDKEDSRDVKWTGREMLEGGSRRGNRALLLSRDS